MIGHLFRQPAAANSAWLIAERAIRLVVSLLITPLVARYLGVYDFGLLAYAINFVFVFQILANFGDDQLLVRLLVEKEGEAPQILGAAFVLRLLGSLTALLVIVAVLSGLGVENVLWFLVLIIFSTFIFQSLNVVDCYFRAHMQARWVAVAQLIQLVVCSLIRIYFVYSGFPLPAFAFAVLFEAVLAAVLSLYFYRTRFVGPVWDIRPAYIKQLFGYAWPLIVVGLIATLSLRIEQFMVKEYLGMAAVGHYMAAVTLAELWYLFALAVVSGTFPLIVSARRQDEGLFYLYLRRLFGLLLWVTAAFAAVLSVFAGPIISVLYGSEYAASAPILSVYVWSRWVLCVGYLWYNWLLIRNEQKHIVVANLGILILNVLANSFLIPGMGILGAAWGTLISYAIAIAGAILIHRSGGVFLKTLAGSFNLYANFKGLLERKP